MSGVGVVEGGWEVARRVEGRRCEMRDWRGLRCAGAGVGGDGEGGCGVVVVVVGGGEGGGRDERSWRSSSS